MREEDALQFGLHHLILPKKLKIDNMKTQTEHLLYSVINKTETQLTAWDKSLRPPLEKGTF